MANALDDYAVLLQNLRDAGCNDDLSHQVLQYVQKDRASCALCLLKQHKQSLLAQLHVDEQRIDSLDYLIYRLTHTTK